MVSYTANSLLDQIKLEAYIPVAQGNFSAAQLLSIADSEILNTICPTLVSMDENWYLESETQAFVGNQASYTLPQYAMWLKLKRVDLMNQNQVLPITRSDVPQLQYSNTNQNGTPYSFFLKHDVVTFFPTPAAGITYDFRIWFYRRPNQMVVESEAAQILSVNKVTGVVTYTAAPPATYTATSFHDFFAGLSPFRRLVTNAQATAQAGATQTFAIADVQDLSPGDWICIHDQTVFPPVPIELYDFVKDLTIAILTKTQSDFDTYNAQKGEIVERMKSVMLAPGARIVSQGKKLTLRGNVMITPRNNGFIY